MRSLFRTRGLVVSVIVMALGVVLECRAQSQNSAPAAPASNQPANSASGAGADQGIASKVPANTELHATLDTPLSTKTSKPGDRFTATVSQPVSGSSGIVIPVGSRLEGEVSETDPAKSATALHGKETLNLRFRDIVLPNGQTVPLLSSLVSVNSTNGKTTQKADNERGSQGKTVTTDTGSAATSIFGEPLKGLAIGSLAGGGYVLATNGRQQVNLPAQTGIVIRLDQPINVQ